MYDKISALLMLILTGALSIIFIFSTVMVGFFSLFTFVFIGILSGLWYKSILMFNKMNIQRKMDELTDKYGEVCHGLIMGISPELIADIYVYLPATNSVSLVKYEITHDFEKFEIGKHVKANFYKIQSNFGEGITAEWKYDAENPNNFTELIKVVESNNLYKGRLPIIGNTFTRIIISCRTLIGAGPLSTTSPSM